MYADGGEQLVSADDLARSILDIAERMRSHIGYIERALDSAEDYARRLYGKDVPVEDFRAGMDDVTRADIGDEPLAAANEAALNLRRAGDWVLNHHYG